MVIPEGEAEVEGQSEVKLVKLKKWKIYKKRKEKKKISLRGRIGRILVEQGIRDDQWVVKGQLERKAHTCNLRGRISRQALEGVQNRSPQNILFSNKWVLRPLQQLQPLSFP
uniref:Uncharacterized protein n=1 Tax=Romanomermis culicivorax TaxID=13658 RepID=A0A915KCK5_ROMCU